MAGELPVGEVASPYTRVPRGRQPAPNRGPDHGMPRDERRSNLASRETIKGQKWVI